MKCSTVASILIPLALIVGIAGGWELNSQGLITIGKSNTKSISAETTPSHKDSVQIQNASTAGAIDLKNFEIDGLSIQGQDVKGFIKNISSSDRTPSDIKIDFLDSNGKLLGESEDLMFAAEDLSPGQQESFNAGSVTHIQTSDDILITIEY